jgi:hypothetical protein
MSARISGRHSLNPWVHTHGSPEWAQEDNNLQGSVAEQDENKE